MINCTHFWPGFQPEPQLRDDFPQQHLHCRDSYILTSGSVNAAASRNPPLELAVGPFPKRAASAYRILSAYATWLGPLFPSSPETCNPQSAAAASRSVEQGD